MVTVFDGAAWIWGAATLPGSLERALLTGGWLRHASPIASPRRDAIERLAVVVPAHDEVAGIARMIAGLLACKARMVQRMVWVRQMLERFLGPELVEDDRSPVLLGEPLWSKPAVGHLPLEGFAAMSRPQVVNLHSRGHEVGSHTLSHPVLPRLDDRELRHEVTGSKHQLETWLDAPVPGFCYPNGDHDERSVRAVSEAGYSYACTTLPGLHTGASDPFRIARVDVTPGAVTGPTGSASLTALRAEICGWHEALRGLRAGSRG